MDFKKLQSLVKKGKYLITLHAQKRMDQRGITIEELKEIIYHGSIVEEYKDDKPYPSCLIMGRVKGGFPLYAVCALEKKVHIVTVHWLDPEKWLDPTTRREKR